MAVKKKITKTEWLKDVVAEIKAIKKNAKSSEINNLDFSDFNPKSRANCIYGQMTGDCRSKDAINLIQKCCKRYLAPTKRKGALARAFEGFSKLNINGPTAILSDNINYASSLEGYIILGQSKPYLKGIIDYIKGESKKLVIK